NHVLINKEDVNGVIITEPAKYGTHISRIDLTFSKEGDKFTLKDKDASTIPVKAEDGTFVKSDEELEKLLQPYHEFARNDANVVVAQLEETNLVPTDEIKGIPAVQIQETPLSDFFHEVMLHYSNADVVAHQIDNDKASLNVGPIKKKDIAFNYQYALGEVSVYEVTGKDLKDYMEWAVSYFNSTREGDVTVSFDKTRRASKYSTNDFFGNVKYDIDLSEESGNRIKNLTKLDGTPIKAEDQLTLGMNSYRMDFLLSKGQALEGRKFNLIWSSKEESAYGETGGTIRNLAIRYLKDEKKGVYQPTIQNNWKIVGVDTTSPARKAVVELVNKGILAVPTTEDGKYTNIASINVKDAITQEEIKALATKANVAPAQFKKVKTTGEFYLALLEALNKPETPKDKEQPAKPETPKGKEQPAKPEVPKDKPVKKETTKNNDKVSKPVIPKGKVTAYHLNVRSKASNSGKVLGSIAKNKEVEILGNEKGWYVISYKGKKGYVYSRYINLLK
ncbi:MAG: 5'-nucleotidase C-terminal domain-containing protein, partial [Priestia megaterium]